MFQSAEGRKGAYDFINILEAPDNQTISKEAGELGARGILQTTTLAALYGRIYQHAKKIEREQIRCPLFCIVQHTLKAGLGIR